MPSSYLHPGVYVEEIPSSVKPIEGVGTSTAIFIGFATQGTVGEPKFISNWDDYLKLYGGYCDTGNEKGDPMAYSVAAFFQNGGTKAYIARLAINTDPKPLQKASGWQEQPKDANKAVVFTAINEGQWANGIVVQIDAKTTPNLYRLRIGRLDTKGALLTQEDFNEVSFDSTSPRYIESVINGFSNLLTVAVKPIDDPAVTGAAVAQSYYIGTSTSGPLTGADLNFSTVSDADRTLNIAIDGGTAFAVILPNTDYTGKLPDLATYIQAKVCAGAAPGTPRAVFTAKVNTDRLILQSNTAVPTSGVAVTGNAAIRCRLGVANSGSETNGVGTSISGELQDDNLKFAAVNQDPDRTLSIAIDGADPFDVVLEKKNYAIVDLAKYIQATVQGVESPETPRGKFTANVKDDNKLILQSNTSGASTVVVKDGGAAAACKLGTANGGTEKVGGGTNISASLATADLDFNSLPASSRTLTLALDGGTAFDILLPNANFADDLNRLARTIQDLVQRSGAPDAACVKFTARATADKIVLASNTGLNGSDVVVTNSGAAARCKLGKDNGGEKTTGQEAMGVRKILGPIELAGGTDGGLPNSAAFDDLFTRLKKFHDINIVCLPGQEWKGASQAIIEKAIAHAEEMQDRIVLIDPPSDAKLVTENDVELLVLSTSTYAVTYYPWIKTANALYNEDKNPGAFEPVLVPPSGYAAGMWAKIDGQRGVWKAPAGVETGLLGVASLNADVDDVDQDALNPKGVNCIRKLPGFGPVIWGARTLSTKAKPEWRYVPVRRTAIYIERSLFNGIQWAVFEGNDHLLWSSLRTNIASFMDGLFRSGAFQGEKASDAYFVRCGLGDTMTQDDIDSGRVIVIVGFAPLKPAEFVIIRIQQKVNKQ